MINLKKIISFALLILLITPSYASFAKNNFAGSWCWDKNNEITSFIITLIKNSNGYKGKYFCVAFSGNRIDDNDDSFKFNVSDQNLIKAKFKSGISGKIGLMSLKIINNNTLEWRVLKIPKDEFYPPNNAILHRC